MVRCYDTGVWGEPIKFVIMLILSAFLSQEHCQKLLHRPAERSVPSRCAQMITSYGGYNGDLVCFMLPCLGRFPGKRFVLPCLWDDLCFPSLFFLTLMHFYRKHISQIANHCQQQLGFIGCALWLVVFLNELSILIFLILFLVNSVMKLEKKEFNSCYLGAKNKLFNCSLPRIA